jgi:hypothetical protein
VKDDFDAATLEDLLEGDHAFLEALFDEGILDRAQATFSPEQAETARLARVLVRDLGANWAGVEIVLHMREEMLVMRRQVARLLEIVRAQR